MIYFIPSLSLGFYNELQKLGDADELLDYLSNVSNCPKLLPFCDVHITEKLRDKRFQLTSDKKIEFFPRERLRSILHFINDNGYFNFLLHGATGAGKSYMLMAFTCYYMTKGERTIYFNSARTAHIPIYWRPKLMFLLYQESKKESNSRDSLYIKKLEALISFIQKDTPLQSLITEIGFSGIKLKILIDQLNELQEDNYSVFDFTKKMVNLNSVVIYSSSANDEIAEVFENNSKQKKLKFIPVFSSLCNERPKCTLITQPELNRQPPDIKLVSFSIKLSSL